MISINHTLSSCHSRDILKLKNRCWAREMAQQLRELVILQEDPNSVPSSPGSQIEGLPFTLTAVLADPTLFGL